MPYDAHGVGYRETDTSHDARPVRQIVGLRKVVYDCIVERPDNCDGVARRTGLSPFTVRPRLTELQTFEFIEDSGERARLNSGRKGIVWRAKVRQLELL